MVRAYVLYLSVKLNRKKRREVSVTISTKMLKQQGLQNPPPFSLAHFHIDYPITLGDYDLTGIERGRDLKKNDYFKTTNKLESLF